MRDYLSIGPVPANEECEQLGTNYNPSKARKECNTFIAQLRRQFGNEPDGARLSVKSNPHDFGTYLDVVCYYDDDMPESVEYAFKCEGEASPNWDDAARAELRPISCADMEKLQHDIEVERRENDRLYERQPY